MKINSNKLKSIFLLSLVGSNLAKEESSKNQSELTLNSLPQIGANFTKRENETDPTLIFGGYPIAFENQKNCFASFALIEAKYNDDCEWGRGNVFLTSSRCCTTERFCDRFTVFSAGNSSKRVGQISDLALTFGRGVFLIDFAVVIPDNGLKLIPYVMGPEDLYPITSLATAAIESQVCAYGPLRGYLCGSVVEMNTGVEYVDPSGETLTFTDVNKVDLGTNGFTIEELGSPVYTKNNIGERTTAQALGYITDIDNSDPNHNFFYYTPIDKVLEKMINRFDYCYYTLLTYNETNAQEYDQLIAQVEIPAKK